jgi:hypothetical protein
MTITDTGRATVDDLMPAARGLAAEKRAVPAKAALQKTLQIGWAKANEIHARLSVEADERRAARRTAMRRVGGRKTRRGVQPARRTALPDKTGAAAITQVSEPAMVFRTASRVRSGRPATWPVLLLTLPAFVVIWSGWVDMGRLTGFGVVHPLPGIADGFALNTAITLPIGLETYAAYALWVWLSGAVEGTARDFARASAIGALALGAAGQVAYHLMIAAGMAKAPWWITTAVACLPVAVLGLGAALRHLVGAEAVSDR